MCALNWCSCIVRHWVALHASGTCPHAHLAGYNRGGLPIRKLNRHQRLLTGLGALAALSLLLPLLDASVLALELELAAGEGHETPSPLQPGVRRDVVVRKYECDDQEARPTLRVHAPSPLPHICQGVDQTHKSRHKRTELSRKQEHCLSNLATAKST